jgi:hypothetical protein
MVNFTPLSVYPEESALGTHCIGRWVGASVGVDAVEYRNMSCPFRKLNRSRPVCSPSLYRLSYFGSWGKGWRHALFGSRLELWVAFPHFDGFSGDVRCLLRLHLLGDVAMFDLSGVFGYHWLLVLHAAVFDAFLYSSGDVTAGCTDVCLITDPDFVNSGFSYWGLFILDWSWQIVALVRVYVRNRFLTVNAAESRSYNLGTGGNFVRVQTSSPCLYCVTHIVGDLDAALNSKGIRN